MPKETTISMEESELVDYCSTSIFEIYWLMLMSAISTIWEISVVRVAQQVKKTWLCAPVLPFIMIGLVSYGIISYTIKAPFIAWSEWRNLRKMREGLKNYYAELANENK